ncbi:ethanolamine ammonia-lyase subunit EutC [Silvimonas soli]|uniref:ethanolamine ammonia-lyase subunit EutC n=1 Tax=Silvimonas soli TaxID=2980100 RepID=UPI0024B354EB|nr:ethanolamine ammonia-lyase subunit EutC [Silvimonas soli]
MTAKDPLATDTEEAVTLNPWQALRQLTPARIALGRAGISQPTAVQLAFQLDHARARDAVHAPLPVEAVRAAIAALGFDTLALHSAAADRHVYLQRPDLGRRLDDASAALLATNYSAPDPARYDIAFVVADGLSSLAIERHAAPLLDKMRQALPASSRIAPVCVVEQGRVAIGDEIGEALGARIVVVMIGERPGLSSPDSMGLYLTWAPRRGLTDAARNCISNVRLAGLSYDEAARRLCYLLREAQARQLSGVLLKDETTTLQGNLETGATTLVPGPTPADAGDY